MPTGTIFGGFGLNKIGCSFGLEIKIPNALEFFHQQMVTGHHLAMVYGDVSPEINRLSNIMNFQVIQVA